MWVVSESFELMQIQDIRRQARSFTNVPPNVSDFFEVFFDPSEVKVVTVGFVKER